jgi:hypothetical protein
MVAIVGLSAVKTVALTVDTAIYADGDVLADLQAVAGFMRADGGRAVIQSVTLLDKSDQAVAMDLFISPSAVSLGTENAAPSISDANAAGLQRICNIGTSDYIDMGGCRIATITGLGLVVEAAAGETTMYIGAVTRGGTPTYGASDLTLLIGLLQD